MVPPPVVGQPLSVAQTITLCNTLLGDLLLTVEGEIASYNVNQGKFVFFDIKDETQEARLSCFMMLFKQSIPLEDGMRVSLTCRPTIHAKSGKFSLTVERVEAKGEGSLKRAFELLKKKLQEEGLFAPERKRILPSFPTRVGIISSDSAAGYGDFMRIVDARVRGVHFVLANVTVQGAEAEQDICLAFDYLNSHHDLDCIVLIRGGGSIEDLHAFNAESVARAIARSKAPVMVGVGHERDITIADFVADVRAATPSNAAQLLLREQSEVWGMVERSIVQGRRLVERALLEMGVEVWGRAERVQQSIRAQLERTGERVEQLVRTISAVSPTATLERGYTLTWTAAGKRVTKAIQVKPGELITTQFADSKVTSSIQ